MSEEMIEELRRKWLPIYVMVLASLLLILAHLALNYVRTGSSVYANTAVLVAFIAMYLAYGLARILGTKIPTFKYFKVVVCKSCGYSRREAAKKGDYLFKETGKCPKCGGPLVIERIYKEKILKGVL